jgi:hypothetical protein
VALLARSPIFWLYVLLVPFTANVLDISIK